MHRRTGACIRSRGWGGSWSNKGGVGTLDFGGSGARTVGNARWSSPPALGGLALFLPSARKKTTEKQTGEGVDGW
jgi:hypothetical protein